MAARDDDCASRKRVMPQTWAVMTAPLAASPGADGLPLRRVGIVMALAGCAGLALLCRLPFVTVH
jgi:hypothetical protein